MEKLREVPDQGELAFSSRRLENNAGLSSYLVWRCSGLKINVLLFSMSHPMG